MSVVLGWVIYISAGLLVIFGIPKAALMLSGDKTFTYREALVYALKAYGLIIFIISALLGFILLLMWAGDLVSGRA